MPTPHRRRRLILKRLRVCRVQKWCQTQGLQMARQQRQRRLPMATRLQLPHPRQTTGSFSPAGQSQQQRWRSALGMQRPCLKRLSLDTPTITIQLCKAMRQLLTLQTCTAAALVTARV